MKPVLTKADFYRRFYAGEFGNHSPMWSTLQDWKASGYDKEVAIRTLRPGGRCDYLIHPRDVARRYASFITQGYRPGELNISAQCPEQDKTIQGEVGRSSRGLELYCSTSVLPMREALRLSGFEVHGLAAQQLLNQHLCSNSLTWMNHLLESYPDHTIEFTTLRYPWGTVPHHNTLIWEVRAY